MYRIIIADDEPWVLYSLVHSIDWEAHGFCICATAENGPEALEKCLALRPDVLFSDIRMPGLDGLELLEKLRIELPDIEVVFISGYADFTYAQQAVRFGAVDYLIKQVTAKQLTEALGRLKVRLEQKMKATLSDAYFAFFEEDGRLSVQEWMKCRSQPYQYPHFRFITFSNTEMNQDFFLKENWLPDSGQLILRTGRNKYSALTGYSSDQNLHEWMITLSKANTTTIGVSHEESNSYSFASLYKQADIAYYTSKITGTHSPLIYRKDYPYETRRQTEEYLKLVENLLKSGDSDKCLPIISQLENECNHYMLDHIAHLFNSLIGLFKRYLPSDLDELEPYSYQRIASEFTNLDAVFHFLKQNLQVPDHINTVECLNQNILQYIDDHYTEELRLPDLAARYHFSPCYFSTLFKKQTGTTLIRYITTKRIALAKKLLRESNLSIQDIVDQVGYNDYFQFIKVFKREVGLTPGSYRSGTM